MKRAMISTFGMLAACALIAASTRGASAQEQNQEMSALAKEKLPPGAKVILVDDDRQQYKNAPFSFINNAIFAANPGDVIRVAPGVYREQVVFTKTVRIEGAQAGKAYSGKKFKLPKANEESVIVTGPPFLELPSLEDTIVTFGANNCTLDGFTVRGNGNTDFSAGAGALEGTANISILNSRFENLTFGMTFPAITNLTVQGCAFLNNRSSVADNIEDEDPDDEGLDDAPQPGYGIYSTEPVAASNISSNVFAGNESGAISLGKLTVEAQGNEPQVVGSPVTNSVFSDNVIDASLSPQSSGSGITLLEGFAITLNKNTIRGGKTVGIFLDANVPNNVTFVPTTITQNTISGVAGDAIFLRNSLISADVSKNTLTANTGSGFYLSEVSTFVNAFNTFTKNVVANNGFAGFRVVASLGNDVRGNQIISNRFGVASTFSQDNFFRENKIDASAVDGIYSDNLTSGNVFIGNKVVNSGSFDIQDDSEGDGTAGTDNIYRNNKAKTADPAALVSNK